MFRSIVYDVARKHANKDPYLSGKGTCSRSRNRRDGKLFFRRTVVASRNTYTRTACDGRCVAINRRGWNFIDLIGKYNGRRTYKFAGQRGSRTSSGIRRNVKTRNGKNFQSWRWNEPRIDVIYPGIRVEDKGGRVGCRQRSEFSI